MNGIKQLSAGGLQRQVSFASKKVTPIETNDTDKKPSGIGAVGLGLVALGVANAVLVTKFVMGKGSDTKALTGVQESLQSLAKKAAKIEQQTAIAGFDKTKAKADVTSIQATLDDIISKINNDKTGRYSKLQAQVSAIKASLAKVNGNIDSINNAQKFQGTIDDLTIAADKLNSQIPVSKKPVIKSAVLADSTPVSEVPFKNGVAYQKDGSIFSGKITYEMPDCSTVDLEIGSDGRIIKSIRRDEAQNTIFEKTFLRSHNDETNIDNLVIKTVYPDGSKCFMCQNTKKEDAVAGVGAETLVTRAFMQGDEKYQVSMLTKGDKGIRLLDGTDPERARLVEITRTDGCTQKVEKISDTPFSYVLKGEKNGIKNYWMSEFPSVESKTINPKIDLALS